MSIRIDKITRGRFGNKILQYINLIQLSKKYNVSASCCSFSESIYFEETITNIIQPKGKKCELLFCKKIIDDEKLDFSSKYYILDDPSYCLHNIFFHVAVIKPNKILKIKQEYKPKLDSNFKHIGIHLRGTDNINIDKGREIHKFEYYRDSINYIMGKYKDEKLFFYLCTDDNKFDTYGKTLNHLNNIKVNYKIGNINSYISDFALLSECDVLINSSSTFCITAGMLGKENKYIIHSKIWLEKNIKHIPWNKNGEKYFPSQNIKMKDYWKTYDNFWINCIKKNDYYFIDKII